MNIVPTLDQNASGIYCPRCLERNVEAPLVRDTYKFACNFGHNFEFPQIQAMYANGGLKMQKAIVIEQPNPYAEKWTIWIMPQVRKMLEEKYAGRIISTIATYLECLATEAYLFIDGDDAKRLRALGFKNGKEMLVALEKAKELETQLTDQAKILEKLTPILEAAGVRNLL